MTYSEKLKDPRWQKKRLEVFERDEWTCQKCFDGESTLHVHHLTYEKGKDPWDYDIDNFITLCAECHACEFETRSDYEKMLLSLIKSKGFLADDVYKIVQGFLKLKIKYTPEVTASIIEFILSTGFEIASDLFFETTQKEIEQRRNGNG
jgi:hypothetical protein